MDIEQFYDADPRRRDSAEVELGAEWHDRFGVRYEVSWVADTGELYVMAEPFVQQWSGPFGGAHVHGVHRVDAHEVQGMSVSVVATIATQADLERILSGWEGQMDAFDSITWVATRLRETGVLTDPAPK